MTRSVWIGFDPRESDAFAVARQSLRRKTIEPYPVKGIILDDVRAAGLYTRPTSRDREGRLFDEISGFPMATEFAISRFLTPLLAKSLFGERATWALFMDSDVLIRRDLKELFDLADPRYAVMCVKHNHVPTENHKMDGQAQLRYLRKNWSSVMLFNCQHPSNQKLNVDLVNTVPGRDLHAFTWLQDEEIGSLPTDWNFLVGHHDSAGANPGLVHFTEGVPSMPGYSEQPFADEWFSRLAQWVRG